MKLGVIGTGNMATAILRGIISNNLMAPDEIIGSARTDTTREKVRADFGINVTGDNAAVVKDAQIVMLAVKPQYIGEVIDEIAEYVDDKKLVISIAAGKTISWLTGRFSREIKLARVMPNTPATVGEAMSGVCFSDLCSDDDKAQVVSIFEGCGKVEIVSETLMDTVTGVSGSSPAFVFMMIEAMADAAVLNGMPRAQAYEFAAQTVLGSAKLCLETGEHPAQLKDKVCSPAGTTIEGVRVLENAGFRSTLIEAITATIEKSKKL